MKIHEDVEPGDGLYPQIADALEKVLQPTVMAMFKAQQPWALMGSLASVLQGMPGYKPPDIDLVTSSEGAYIMEGAISACGTMIRPVSHSSRGPYTSYFGIFEVDGVKTEVMGDLLIDCEDGALHARDHWDRWSDRVRVLHFRKMHIPVVPLEWQIVANALLDRPERVYGISSYLLRVGYDGEYLGALLQDQQYGERTLRMVREALHLDG